MLRFRWYERAQRGEGKVDWRPLRKHRKTLNFRLPSAADFAFEDKYLTVRAYLHSKVDAFNGTTGVGVPSDREEVVPVRTSSSRRNTFFFRQLIFQVTADRPRSLPYPLPPGTRPPPFCETGPRIPCISPCSGKVYVSSCRFIADPFCFQFLNSSRHFDHNPFRLIEDAAGRQ